MTFGLEERVLDEAVVRAAVLRSSDRARSAIDDVQHGAFADDGGLSVHVCDARSRRELLRFDCFAASPHYHYIPVGGGNHAIAFDADANGEMVSWVAVCLRSRLPAMLTRAGAADLAGDLDRWRRRCRHHRARPPSSSVTGERSDMVKLDEIQTADFTVTRKSARADVPAGAGTTATEVHGDLGRRPHRRAARHVRRAACPPRSPIVRRGSSRPSGGETWVYDGDELPNVGFNAVAGRPVSEYSWEPARFDEMRRGAWDIDARVHDMDLNGIYASVNFPSFLAGFSGYRLQLGHDADLALAVVRAWNDYHLEVWAGTHPGRIIPLQLPWLLDPEVAAQEIRRNAERGFRAVSFTESPDKMDLPSLYSDHWDPFFRACEETETVLCLHFGSSGTTPTASDEAPPEAVHRAVRRQPRGRRRLAVRQDPAAVPGHQALPVGGRHRLGPRVARPARGNSTTMSGAWRPTATMDDQLAIHAEIACPVLLVWGRESWMPDPDTDERASVIRNRRVLKVDGAGHWVHHDRLDLFLEESKRFLLEP